MHRPSYYLEHMLELGYLCGRWISTKINADRTPIIQIQNPDWKDFAGWIGHIKGLK